MRVHFTPVECELLVDSLEFWIGRVEAETEDRFNSFPGHRRAGRYVVRRAKELRDKISALMPSATQGDAP